MRYSSSLALAAVLILGAATAPAIAAAERSDGVTIFAAASTTECMQTIAKAYEAARQVTVTCSFGSSSTLAKQIEQGAPADLFLSADQKWMDYLAERKAIVTASRADLLGNVLVLIAPADKPVAVTVDKGFRIGDAFSGRLALADPASVPAGIYAKEAFTSLGWWEQVSGRLAPTADVRAALKLVELGETDLGVVYATDAKVSAKVTTVATIPGNLHSPIRYPVALTATSKPAAAAFLVYLEGPAARAVFTQAGFITPGEAPTGSTPTAP